LIIEARLGGGDSDTVNDGDGVLAVVERRDCGHDQPGLTLAEGRSLLAKVQAELISKQVQWWLSGQTHCRLCRCAETLAIFVGAIRRRRSAFRASAG